jgi:hypothetical protein
MYNILRERRAHEMERDRKMNRRDYMERHDIEREMFRKMRRGPRDYYMRGGYGSDDESPERFYDVPSSMKPNFRLREGVDYANLMLLFEKPNASLRYQG